MLGLFFHRILSPEHNEVPLKSEVVLTRSSFGDTDICSVEHITCSAYDSKSVTNSGVSLFWLRMSENWFKHSKNSVPSKRLTGTGFVVFILYFCERNVFTCPVAIFIWLFSLIEIYLKKFLSSKGNFLTAPKPSLKLIFNLIFLSEYTFSRWRCFYKSSFYVPPTARQKFGIRPMLRWRLYLLNVWYLNCEA